MKEGLSREGAHSQICASEKCNHADQSLVKFSPLASPGYFTLPDNPFHSISHSVHSPTLLDEHVTPSLSHSSYASSLSSFSANDLPSYLLRKQNRTEEMAHTVHHLIPTYVTPFCIPTASLSELSSSYLSPISPLVH